jgi:hypothetical protein
MSWLEEQQRDLAARHMQRRIDRLELAVAVLTGLVVDERPLTELTEPENTVLSAIYTDAIGHGDGQLEKAARRLLEG